MLSLSAKRHEVSENLLLEKILRSTLYIDPLLDAFQVVVLGKATLEMFVATMEADSLEKLAFEQGKKDFIMAKQIFESNGMMLTYFEFVIRVLGKEAKWFKVEGQFVKPENLTLLHSCGMKWSLFLKGYVLGAYEAVSRDKLKIEVSEQSVSILFSVPPEMPARASDEGLDDFS